MAAGQSSENVLQCIGTLAGSPKDRPGLQETNSFGSLFLREIFKATRFQGGKHKDRRRPRKKSWKSFTFAAEIGRRVLQETDETFVRH